MEKSTNQKVFEIVYESERVADLILVNKQEIVELDKRRQSNREAIRELTKSTDKKTWITVGSMLIEMRREEAIKILQEGEMSTATVYVHKRLSKIEFLSFICRPGIN